MQRYLVLDYETRSEFDLKKGGAEEYARHPSTDVLCAAWRFGTKEELKKKATQVWSPAFARSIPSELRSALLDPQVKIVAHNAGFEQAITRHVLARKLAALKECTPIERWVCTAAMSAALALPRSLEKVLEALNLPVQKDMEGHKLVLRYCKPRKPTKKNPAKWHNKASDLRRIMEYCKLDVDGTVELLLNIPDLIPFERRVWELDQKINQRGFCVDRELVQKILGMIAEEKNNLDTETQDLSFNTLLSATQRDGVLEFLKLEGVELPNLRKNTVENVLKEGNISEDAKRMLELRQAISKTSTAKYLGFELRTRTDGRLRGSLVYHAAGPGRWGGSGIQPQNFPRGAKGLNAAQAIDDIKAFDLETLRMLYGDPMTVFATVLRGMIIASPGKKFNAADYSSIEARILFWLADHIKGVQAFRDNRKIYEEMAQVIFSIRDLENVQGWQRQVGKQAILGCGYSMGPPKFKQTCLDVGGIEISIDLAKQAVQAYRRAHYPVAELWKNIERMAMAAVLNPGKKYGNGKIKWFMEGKFLFCELPSGRRNAYYNPEIRYEPTPWGALAPKLYHWGVNPRTKKWSIESTYGGKLTENCVQGIARDFMADAMLRLEEADFEVTLTVHDEIKSEDDIGRNRLAEFIEIMCDLPAWGEGCPIKADGWEGERYRK